MRMGNPALPSASGGAKCARQLRMERGGTLGVGMDADGRIASCLASVQTSAPHVSPVSSRQRVTPQRYPPRCPDSQGKRGRQAPGQPDPATRSLGILTRTPLVSVFPFPAGQLVMGHKDQSSSDRPYDCSITKEELWKSTSGNLLVFGSLSFETGRASNEVSTCPSWAEIFNRSKVRCSVRVCRKHR